MVIFYTISEVLKKEREVRKNLMLTLVVRGGTLHSNFPDN
jgi:hypothetical protein